MPDHPSIQGLREAIAGMLTADANNWRAIDKRIEQPSAELVADLMMKAQSAYLAEHAVLLSGEGLVRAEHVADRTPDRTLDGKPAGWAYFDQSYTEIKAFEKEAEPLHRLVPVPQDGEG